MKFTIKKPRGNLVVLMRKLLYSPQAPHQNKFGTGQDQDEKTGELQFARFLAPSGYPRFHLYIKGEENEFIFNLHLDQKRPSYQGSAAHNAEYDGETVAKEAERIKQGLIKNT